jgi:large subunit ribosomal protein L13
VDTGDFVVVVNSSKVKMSGTKWWNKKYYSRSRFFGSLKELTAQELREKESPKIIEDAVIGMLPKNRLGRKMIKKLKVYTGAEHPHATQKPEALNI